MKRTTKSKRPSRSVSARELGRVGGGFGGDEVGDAFFEPEPVHPVTRIRWSGSLPGDTGL